MAMSVTKGSSSPGREAAHAGFEKVTISWTTHTTGIASDNISLVGAIQEVILAPGAAAPTDSYLVRLRDVDDSTIDYTCGGWTGTSDETAYIEPLVSAVTPPVVLGDVVFHVSDATAEAKKGTCYIFLKT